MGIDIKTIILHYKKLNERKENMLKQMIKFGFNDYSFYENYDGNEIDQNIIDEHYISGLKDIEKWKSKVSLWGPVALLYHPKECNIAEISLTIKFGKVFEILSKLDNEYFIIFEDDVLLCEDFDLKFHEFMKKTPSDWDAIYFGSGANLKPTEIQKDKIAYLKEHPASRCADSIIIKNKTIKDLAKTWFPFNLISDWELGHQHYFHKHKVYWWEPSLVKQGSEYGVFKSTLR